MKTHSRNIPALVILTMVFLAASQGTVHATQCTVNFDSPTALGNLYNQARASFANWSSAGNTLCPTKPNTDTGTCFVYRHPCAPGTNLTVVPQVYSHYHLGFSSPDLNPPACFKNGGFARKINGVCTAANWANEPRDSAESHDLGEWFEIASKPNGSEAWGVFRLQTIRVGTTGPIQLWYMATDGTVWGWSNLAANTNWGIYTGDIVAVWVSAADGSSNRFNIVDFVATN